MKKILFIITAAVISFTVTAQSYKGSVIHKTYEEKLNEEYCTGLFKTAHGQLFDIASDNSANSYFNILDWLQGRVAGLRIYKTYYGLSVPVIRGTIPGIYIDEIPTTIDLINAISTNDIAMIKVIKSPFYGGFNGAGGAIAIYTIRGGEEEE